MPDPTPPARDPGIRHNHSGGSETCPVCGPEASPPAVPVPDDKMPLPTDKDRALDLANIYDELTKADDRPTGLRMALIRRCHAAENALRTALAARQAAEAERDKAEAACARAVEAMPKPTKEDMRRIRDLVGSAPGDNVMLRERLAAAGQREAELREAAQAMYEAAVPPGYDWQPDDVKDFYAAQDRLLALLARTPEGGT